MEVQSTPLNWDFFHEDEGIMMEGIWDSFLHKTVELETRVASAKEEMTRKEVELLSLKDFLIQAMREREEAESKCQTIMLDILTLQQKQQIQDQAAENTLARQERSEGKPLPEKGRLLEAVMEAGPLLQTLLLAGPLPEWQHPPPRVDAAEIPPVDVSARPPVSFFRPCLGHKRSLIEASPIFPSDTKCQKVIDRQRLAELSC